MNALKICGALALGVAVGVLATRGYFDKKYSDRADEEINQVIDEVNKRLEEYQFEDAKEKVEEVKEEEPEVVESNMLKNYISSEPDHIDYARGMNDVHKKENVYAISADAFISEHPEYDKTTLLYFEEDDTLCDIGYEIVAPEKTIGQNNLDMFAGSSNQDGYFRNEATETDYEVTKEENSYRDYIGGDD